VDRNYGAGVGDQVGVAAGAGVINGYDAKGVDKRTAGLLYNVGLNSGTMADAATLGNTNATTFHYTPQHADAVDTGADTAYNLTAGVGLTAYITARSLDKDPRLDAGNTD
jgi:hypothetical protein